LHAAIDGGGEPLQCRLAVLDDLAQHAQREEPVVPPLLLEDDLREGDGGQVLAGVVLEDLHVLASLHPAPDLVERHVAALARVVELAVAVAFDESAHRSLPGITAPRAGTTFDENLHCRPRSGPPMAPKTQMKPNPAPRGQSPSAPARAGNLAGPGA